MEEHTLRCAEFSENAKHLALNIPGLFIFTPRNKLIFMQSTSKLDNTPCFDLLRPRS